jgi:hypothetical protein
LPSLSLKQAAADRGNGDPVVGVHIGVVVLLEPNPSLAQLGNLGFEVVDAPGRRGAVACVGRCRCTSAG